MGRPDLTVHAGGSAVASPVEEPSESTPARGVLAVEVPAPDHVRETYLEVRAARDGEVVTVLEILSPANKVRGEGRRLY